MSHQPAIITDPKVHAIFVIVRVNGGHEQKVAAAIGNFHKLVAEVSAKNDNVEVAGNIGVGFELLQKWKHVFGNLPGDMKAPIPFEGSAGIIPATGGDIFLHIKSDRQDLCWEVAFQFVRRQLPRAAIVSVDEAHGWKYRDGRDLTGFIDGTANPDDAESRTKAAIISGADDKEHAGGSFVLGQRWIHNLDAIAKMTADSAEKLVGRKIPNSRKIENMPESAHVARMQSAGEDFKVMRQSMPFGTSTEHGLFFVAYSAKVRKFERMLERMVGAAGHGPADGLMSVSKAVSSGWWYVPTVQELAKLASSASAKL